MDDKFTITLDTEDDPTLGTYISDGTITIDLGNWDTDTIDLSGGYGVTGDFGSVTNWGSFSGRFKSIDLELLDKYPTAKNLYEEFISVYNICEAEEELNGDDEDDIPF